MDLLFKYQDFLKERSEDWIYIEEREQDRQSLLKIEAENQEAYVLSLTSRLRLLLAQTKQKCHKGFMLNTGMEALTLSL